MRLATKIVLAFTMMMMLFTGCISSLYPPFETALLQVESPPHRTTLICEKDDMTPEMVAMCMNINNRVAYKDYKFNENFIFSVTAVENQSNVRTNSDSTSLTTSRSATITDNRPPDEKGVQ